MSEELKFKMSEELIKLIELKDEKVMDEIVKLHTRDLFEFCKDVNKIGNPQKLKDMFLDKKYKRFHLTLELFLEESKYPGLVEKPAILYG
jgi:hypothetical protein